ncbi:MAG: oxidoreductase, partial [Shimia sp.]|nr:oxidoreductase [Shimia sp.]
MDEDEIAAIGADQVISATGAQPASTGFQKALPHVEKLPGLENGHVWSPEDVLGKAAQLGPTVIVLDEGGHWRGIGTAWYLAEAG